MLKSKNLQALCLVLVDVTNKSMELEVHMDASQCALGGVLLACVKGNQRLVAYHSYKLNTAEVNYSRTKFELLTIVNHLHHFHHSLLGRKFHICTDPNHWCIILGSLYYYTHVIHIGMPSCMSFYLECN